MYSFFNFVIFSSYTFSLLLLKSVLISARIPTCSILTRSAGRNEHILWIQFSWQFTYYYSFYLFWNTNHCFPRKSSSISCYRKCLPFTHWQWHCQDFNLLLIKYLPTYCITFRETLYNGCLHVTLRTIICVSIHRNVHFIYLHYVHRYKSVISIHFMNYFLWKFDSHM